MQDSVVDALLVAAPALGSVSRGELWSTLSGLLASARTAWPQVQVSDEDFATHLGRHADPSTGLAGIRASDLYLAYACSRGDVAAIGAFEELTFSEIDRAGASARASLDTITETKAHLRQLMFVGIDGRPAATRDFTGRGDLRGWVRVSALRHILRLQGRAKREVALEDEDLLAALSPAEDPELAYIRDLYRGAFTQAFRDAVAALGQREKSLLRYQLIEGLSIDDIGALHGVHRSTAARWVAAARDALGDHTRRLLGEQLGARSDEIESIIRLVQSRIDVSVERLFSAPE